MAGYDGFSMSNRAREAYERGCLPASKLAKRIGGGATAAGVKKVLSPREWHHTSKHFNQTDFYDLDHEVEKWAENKGISQGAARVQIVDEVRAASKVEKVEVIHQGCSVEWLEWFGTKKHPFAETQYAYNCTVFDKGGQMVVVQFENGRQMKKSRVCGGFCVKNEAGTINIVNV